MKLGVCDICLARDGKLTRAVYRSSLKSGALKATVDLCREHGDIPKVEKWNITKFQEVAMEAVGKI
jgi:hypothetical protein